MRTLTVFLAILLTGCAATKPPLATVEVREVRVPVVVACVDEKDVPAVHVTAMPNRDAGIEALANGAAADIVRLRALSELQSEMLKVCSRIK